MRWMLAVDTCGSAGSVALAEVSGQGFRVTAERALPGRETQEQLMLGIGDVLAEGGVGARDVDVLGVVTGPGSFTGVRIGLAAVKGLAESLGKPVVAVSRLAVLAAQAPGGGLVEAWLDAGRGDVFSGVYRDGVCVRETMLPGSGLVVEDGAALVVLEEVVAERVRANARISHLSFAKVGHPASSADVLMVVAVGVKEALPLMVAAAGRGEFAETALLDANYLRVPDAELARLRADAERAGAAA